MRSTVARDGQFESPLYAWVAFERARTTALQTLPIGGGRGCARPSTQGEDRRSIETHCLRIGSRVPSVDRN